MTTATKASERLGPTGLGRTGDRHQTQLVDDRVRIPAPEEKGHWFYGLHFPKLLLGLWDIFVGIWSYKMRSKTTQKLFYKCK